MQNHNPCLRSHLWLFLPFFFLSPSLSLLVVPLLFFFHPFFTQVVCWLRDSLSKRFRSFGTLLCWNLSRLPVCLCPTRHLEGLGAAVVAPPEAHVRVPTEEEGGDGLRGITTKKRNRRVVLPAIEEATKTNRRGVGGRGGECCRFFQPSSKVGSTTTTLLRPGGARESRATCMCTGCRVHGWVFTRAPHTDAASHGAHATNRPYGNLFFR